MYSTFNNNIIYTTNLISISDKTNNKTTLVQIIYANTQTIAVETMFSIVNGYKKHGLEYKMPQLFLATSGSMFSKDNTKC